MCSSHHKSSLLQNVDKIGFPNRHNIQNYEDIQAPVIAVLIIVGLKGSQPFTTVMNEPKLLRQNLVNEMHIAK